MVQTLCSGVRKLTTRRQWLGCVALAGLLLLGAASIDAQPPVRLVLMLQSLDRGNLTLDRFTGNFRVELDQLVGSPVNVVQVVVGDTGIVGAPELAVVDYIRSTFAEGPTPDLIVTTGGPAALFARKYRRQLFPDTELLFASVDQGFLRTPLAENETAVTVTHDYPQIINDLLQVRPQTRQIFMIIGSGQIGEYWRRELESQFKQFAGRATFVWSDNLSLAEIVHRTASLPADAAIFYLTFNTDASGAAYADERVLADIHASASVPMFGVHSPLFGHGIVGGRLLYMDDVARKTADVATRLLNGAPPESMRFPPQPPGQPMFDWRELNRWGIPESRLPAGSVVLHRGPSLWSEYRATALTAVGVLIVQSLLIAGLLYQRRARQRAEIDSRRNLALAADANRRQTMSALTSSIAHEVGQPLSAMIHNAQALQLMITANQATPETTAEILADIRTQGLRATQIVDRHRTMLRSHQVDKKPVDIHAVINESLALVAHDLRARGIDVGMSLAPIGCTVTGDQVLLQQVLVNLLMNAMDAMAETPPATRQVAIGTESLTGKVAISVRDTGTGLPADLDGTLFTPFFTTKSKGLGIGLTIARTVVEGHGGTIDAGNNSDGGATFTVTLPCDTTSAGTGE
jgi:signal transduction histidine kinase